MTVVPDAGEGGLETVEDGAEGTGEEKSPERVPLLRRARGQWTVIVTVYEVTSVGTRARGIAAAAWSAGGNSVTLQQGVCGETVVEAGKIYVAIEAVSRVQQLAGQWGALPPGKLEHEVALSLADGDLDQACRELGRSQAQDVADGDR